MVRRHGVKVLLAAIVAMMVVACSSPDSGEIPEGWEHGNWSGPTAQHEWIVNADECVVSAHTVDVDRRVLDELVDGTQEEREELLSDLAASAYYNVPDDLVTEPINVHFDGVAVHTEVDGNGLEAAYLYHAETDTIWLVTAMPLRGEVDSFVFEHFVPSFDPDTLPEPAQFQGMLELPPEA